MTGILKSKSLKSALTTVKTHEPLLLLDFDDWNSYRGCPERLRFLCRWNDLPLSDFRLRRFRTRRGWHVVIYYNGEHQFTATEIVAAQSISGSDWRRESFNLIRARNLAAAPAAWRVVGAWNTLYLEKLEHGTARRVYRETAQTGH